MIRQTLEDLKNLTTSLLAESLRPPLVERPLLPGKEEGFVLIVNTIKSAAREWGYLSEPGIKRHLGDTLCAIYVSSSQLSSASRKTTASIRPGECNTTLEMLYQYEHRLLMLYSWLVRRYFRYFDQESLLPPLVRESNRQSIDSLLHHVSALMHAKKVPRSLVEILLSPLRDFLRPGAPLSFSEFEKFSRYRKALLLLLNNSSINKAVICKLLHEQGCNNLRFLNWQTRYLADYAGRYGSLRDQVSFYQYHLKVCRQLPPCKDQPFENGPASTQLLDNWLSCEIDYLQHKETALLARKAAAEERAPKAILTITVPQLACFARLMLETKILKSNNLSDVMRRICSIISTDRTVRVSPYSLLKKSQNIEPGTMHEVKSILADMLREARNLEQAN